MISRLRGEVVTRSPTGVVLDVGGVGYLVNPTDSARRKAEPGGEVVLETYLHVREDALQLFGFAETALAGTDPEAPPEERVREALRRAA